MKTLTGRELDELLSSYSRLTHQFELEGGYACRSEVVGVLKGLGFEEEDFSRKIGTLSGGQKTRVALGRLLLSNPDIILLDLNIPRVSGLEILEFLKKEEMQTRVIVVSCQEEFDVVKKAMKLGAYDYLRKLNLSSDELESILEKCLGETEERNKVHMQGIREIRYEEIMRDSRDIFAGTCNYQTLICILAKDTEELSGVMEMIHKWAETDSGKPADSEGKSVWIFPAERKTGKICLYGIKRKGQSGKQAENCTWESLKVAWKKLRILFGLLRWPSRYSFSVIMIKKRNWCFFRRRLKQKVIVHEECMDIWIP